MEVRSFASRLESGSSIKNTCGLRTMARPSATRCRCPPDRVAGLRSIIGISPNVRAAPSTRAMTAGSRSICLRANQPTMGTWNHQRNRCISRGNVMLPRTVMCG